MIALEIYKFFADYIFKHAGINYSENDYYRLDSRLNSLVKNLKVESVEEAYSLYRQNVTPEMHADLVDLFTNNETFFMRDLKPFKCFANELLEQFKESRINVWSCACSTGQEPYSILMSVDTFSKTRSIENIELLATDISKAALSKAKSGEYTGLEVQRGLPAPFLIKYFEKGEVNWKVKERLRNNIKFQEFNIMNKLFPLNKYQIVFCRNVLIYQTMENKQLIMERLFSSLVPGGFLVLGAGESLIGLKTDFVQEKFTDMTVFKRPSLT